MKNEIISFFKDVDYIFDIRDGQVIYLSKRVTRFLGIESKAVFSDIDGFLNFLGKEERDKLSSKKTILRNKKEAEINYTLHLENQRDFKVKDVFWYEEKKDAPEEKQIKGKLFFDQKSVDSFMDLGSIMDILDKYPEPLGIFSHDMKEAVFVNEKIFNLISIPVSILAKGFPLSKFFYNYDDFIHALEWVENKEEIKYFGEYRLNLGENQPRWYEMNLERILVNGTVCISVSLKDIDQAKKNDLKLIKMNKMLNALNDAQNQFLISDDINFTFTKLLGDLLEVADCELGFFGEVLYSASDSPTLQIHATSDESIWGTGTIDMYIGDKEGHLGSGMLEDFFGTGILAKKVVLENRISMGPKQGTHDVSPGLKNFLGIPVINESAVIGFLALANKSEGFDQEDLEIFRPFIATYKNIIQTLGLNKEKDIYQNKINQNEYIFDKLTKNSSDIIFICGDDMNVKYVSPAAEKILGYTFAEPKLIDVIRDIAVQTIKLDREKNTAVYRSKLKVISKSGKGIWLDSVLSPIISEEEELEGYVATSRDVTGRVQLELKLRQDLVKEKAVNKLQSEFVSLTSHEFKTPLATIKSSIEICKFYLELNQLDERAADFKKHFDKMDKEISKLNMLLSNILNLEKLSHGITPVEKRKIHFLSYMESLNERLFSKLKVDFYVEVPAELTIAVDTTLLDQVLINLLENALKYGHPETKPILKSFVAGDKLKISVQDFGEGIPDEDRKNIFQPFYRGSNVKNEEGTGLGLVVVKKFVELLDGRVSFVSDKTGTIFTIEFDI